MVDDEIRRYAKVLEAVVKLSDLSTRELERRLELGGGTLNRIFTGKIDLKLRHVLLVLEVVGMKPERFFQLACSRPPAAANHESSLAAEILESFQRFGYSIGRPLDPPDSTGATSPPGAATGADSGVDSSHRSLSRPVSDAELDHRIEAALERVLGRTVASAPRPLVVKSAAGGESDGLHARNREPAAAGRRPRGTDDGEPSDQT